MRQKLFTFLLAIVTSSGIYAADVCYLKGIEYTLYTNLTASVTGHDENATITTANIPDVISALDATFAVTSIGEYAFSDCSSLTYVTIPKSVTSIGDGAFIRCSGLTSIDVASDNSNYCSVDGVLFNKDKTTLIQYPGAKQGAYTIPNSVTSIGVGAFSKCKGLTSVTIPNSVTSIGVSAFADCNGLTSVTIPNSVTSIGGSAFAYCSGLTSVTIPNSVTSIGNSAFAVCTGLTSVTIGNGVTSIGDEAFYYCTGLTSVTIGNSVTSIGVLAFDDCSSLTSIDVASDNSNYCSVDGVLFNKDKTTLIQYPEAKQGTYTIPNSVTSIGDDAFAGCDGLTSLTIPNSVTSIGERAFLSCDGLTSVTIPNSVTSMGGQAFSGCESLTSVTIPNSVTSIEEYAFENCSGLTSVTIPNSVTSIENRAFSDCSSLTSVTIPNSVTSIENRAFSDCSSLTSVTIPNSVTSIGDRVFEGCTGLTSVTNYASTPQNLGSYVWNGVDKSTCVLYVPAGSVSAYKSAIRWKSFSNILPIGAQPAEVTTTTVTPSATTADIAWPQVTDAATYTIEIKKNGELICTLTFNAQGQLISIALAAPSRNNAPQRAQAAGFAFTVTSLDSGTSYSYTMTAKGNNGNVLKTESGSFTTTGDAQGVEEVLSNQVPSTKILRNGQVFILRGDKIYNAQGALVK